MERARPSSTFAQWRPFSVAALCVFVVGLSLCATTALAQPTFLTKWGSQGTGQGQFIQPLGLGVAPNGDVLVADPGSSRIQRFDRDGHFLLQWGSTGAGQGQFNVVMDVAVGADGTCYVTDRDNQRIQVFDAAGNYLREWLVVINGITRYPRYIAVGPNDGHLFVTIGYGIAVYTPEGTLVRSFGGYGSGGRGLFLDPPWGIGVSWDDYVYVADQSGDRVQRFSVSGGFVSQWGVRGDDPGQLRFPTGIAVLPSNRVLVSDDWRVSAYSMSFLEAVFQYRWGSTQGYEDSQFIDPWDVAVSPSGDRVYVSDATRRDVQVFLYAPISTRVWTWGTLKSRYR